MTDTTSPWPNITPAAAELKDQELQAERLESALIFLNQAAGQASGAPNHARTLIDYITELIGQRDRARDLAAALEDEIAAGILTLVTYPPTASDAPPAASVLATKELTRLGTTRYIEAILSPVHPSPESTP